MEKIPQWTDEELEAYANARLYFHYVNHERLTEKEHDELLQENEVLVEENKRLRIENEKLKDASHYRNLAIKVKKERDNLYFKVNQLQIQVNKLSQLAGHFNRGKYK